MNGNQQQWTSVLQRYWGYNSFRGIQQQIIESVSQGHDTLGLMPTGGGKSITFQVPTLCMEGMCLVVTPLIALMKDQVQNLKARGIQAAAIYSGQMHSEVVRHLDNAIFGAYKFLYVSPERLATPLFMNKVRRMKVCLITVDEAHCISQWGYDFRPHYLKIADIRQLMPRIPVLALTATAPPRVVDDIQKHLLFREQSQVFKMSFERKNLHYIVRPTDNKEAQLVHILRHVSGSAIVYTRSRKGTRLVAEMLNAEGIPSLYYHAGLSSLDKDTRQQAWQADDVRVMVATNAFGMGIDKPDVRVVVHMDVPDSIEAYFQEAGRGGRDGNTAYAVLLYDKSDARRLRSRVPQTFPDKDYIRKVYTDLASFLQVAEGEAEGRTFDFNINRFCQVFKHHPVMLVSALNILTRAGYIHFSLEDQNSSRMMFLVRRDELYHVDYLDASEERILNALMRKNGGFFTDYVSINENDIAEQCGFTHDEVYDKLCHMTRLRVINYVPHKSIPQVTYTQRRIDTQYVELRPEIYEQRLRLYKERIEAMVGYFTQTTECRSRYLLHYFNDDAPACQHCDICIERQAPSTSPSDDELTSATLHIQTILSDRKAHPVSELNSPQYRDKAIDMALQQLISDEKIMYEGINIKWCDK